jgi:hypothetical protein
MKKSGQLVRLAFVKEVTSYKIHTLTITYLQWLIRLPAIVAIDLDWLYKDDKWKHMMEVDVGRYIASISFLSF